MRQLLGKFFLCGFQFFLFHSHRSPPAGQLANYDLIAAIVRQRIGSFEDAVMQMRRDGEKLQRGGGWLVVGELAAGGDGRKLTLRHQANDEECEATAARRPLESL